MTNDRKYWFPAKRYGWGWGLPVTWQGWAVLIAYFVLVGTGVWVFDPEDAPALFVAYLVFLSLCLLAICRAKGEPTRWRWGGK
jgi:hypothetical protein